MTEQANDRVVDAREPRRRCAVVTTVDGIGLGVRHGGAFGLLGPDGAGRRTTVEVLPGGPERGGGEVSVLGTDPATGTRAWRSRIGIVRQDESAPAGLTARRFAHRCPRPDRGSEGAPTPSLRRAQPSLDSSSATISFTPIDVCSPDSMSLSWTTPSARSRSPATIV